MQINLNLNSVEKLDSKLESIFQNFVKQKTFNPKIWAIFGDDDYSLKKTSLIIKKKFYPNDDFEYIKYFPLINFEWDNFLLEGSNLSLFSKEKLFDLKFSSEKLGIKGSNGIIELTKKSKKFSHILLSFPFPDYSTRKMAWFNAIDEHGILLVIKQPNYGDIQDWVKNSFKKLNIEIEPDAVELICQKSEGNLTMANNEIQKILILNSYETEKSIDLKLIQKSMTDFSKYNPFILPDLIFREKNTKKSIKIINALEKEGCPIALIIWILSQESRKGDFLLQKNFSENWHY